jgi:hypothetical protein
MAAFEQLSRAKPYLGRLLEDEYIQDQLGQVLTELRRSSRRAKGRSASEALADRRLREQLRSAANSLTEALRALSEPPAKGHAVRRALLATAAAAGAALAWQNRSTGEEAR